jgi:short-subunit dehydrogenase
MQKVLIAGATSAIAQALARRLAARGDRLFLAARDPGRLEAVRQDLAVRGTQPVGTRLLDLTDRSGHAALLDAAAAEMGGLDLVVVAYGTLPDQKSCQASVEATLEAIDTNALSTVALLTLVANRFEAQRAGRILVLSSVAGDRGRQSNYVYGAAKGMLSLYLQGLRNRLQPAGVGVLTVKPGFVDTPMTAAFAKGPLWASPDRVAADIVRALDRGRDVLYTPWFWAVIMLVIRSVPEALFKRLRL